MAVARWAFLLCLLFCVAWTKDSKPHDRASFIQLIEDSIRDHSYLAGNQVKICAFNIQVFGRAKMGKPEVVLILRKILVQYDVVFIQEIRDITGTAIRKLLNEINEESGMAFSMTVSDRLGRTSSKEQYAFLHRFQKVQITSTYRYPDENDVFERPPFVVKIRAFGTQVQEFGFIGIHVKPTDAVKEVDALVDVYDHMVEKWGIKDFVFGGDFNAGGSYIRLSDWPNIRLRQQKRFHWLIYDNAKTNIAKTKHCAYDRFVIAGSRLLDAYVAGSATVYRFDQVHHLSYKQTLAVSDHYPIEFAVR